ncbi:MAG TPA: diguanylate cyclase [Piscirickettsiaceae bacterium]|nr:diguanylate cyclase [Piscirickettsiaceae bacterium]HIQ39539.1 diguanylate cyclase [Sulfurivirga caldicuralii]
MYRGDLFSVKSKYGIWKIWWRFPLAIVLIVTVAHIQWFINIGGNQVTWGDFIILPVLVGSILGIVWTIWGVYRARLIQMVKLMHHLVEGAKDVLLLCRQDSFVFISPSIRELTGYDAQVFELSPHFFEKLIHKDDQGGWQAFQRALWQGEVGQPHEYFFQLQTPLKGVVWVRVEARCFDFYGERFCRCVLRDISDEVNLKKTLKRLLEEDVLTGLPNRGALIKACMSLPASNPVTCLMIDVVELRQINVRFGIEAGDFVLQNIAERLQNLSKYPDNPGLVLAARVVGDNFALIFHAPQEQVEWWMSQHISELSKPVFSENLRLFIELHLEVAYHEIELDEELTQHQLEQMLRAAYLKLHPVSLTG